MNQRGSLIENLSSKFAFYLCKSKDESSEEFEVLKYGVFSFLHISIGFVATIVFGLLTGTLLEMVVISLIGAMMKRNCGGVHCSSPNRCLLTGIILAYIFTLIGRFVIYTKQEYSYALCVFALIHSFIIIYKKCPVPCENKPLKKKETRERLRKNAFKIYLICFMLFIFNILLNYIDIIDNLNHLIFYMMIGLYMQTLSLTNIGINFILLLDKVLLRFKV